MNNSSQNLEQLIAGAYQIFQQGNTDLALQVLENLKRKFPPHAKVLHLEGMVLKAMANFDDAIKSLSASILLDETSAEAHNSIANLYQQKQNWAAALEHYQLALNIKPDYLDANRNLGLCQAAQGELESARQTFLALTRSVPKDVSSWVALANLERKAGNFEIAEDHYASAVLLNKGYFNAWYNRGVNAKLIGDALLAEQCFKSAFALAENSENAVISLAGIEFEKGEHDKAKLRLSEFLENNPSAISVHKTLDRLLWESGSNAKEVTHSLRNALASQPQNQALFQAYVEQLLLTKNAQAALPIAQELIKRFGPDDKSLALRAKCYAMLDAADKAIDDYQHCLKLSHRNSVANELVQILLLQDNYLQAQDILRTNLKENANCQLSWALQGLVWRAQNDDRYHWLHQYDSLVKAYRIEAPNGYSNLAEYLDSLKEVLLDLHHAESEPLEQTLRNGSQTAPKLFFRKVKEIELLKASCSDIVTEYLSGLVFDNEHPFLKRLSSSFIFSGSWSVRLFSQGFHVNHIHPEGWISSSTYISMPQFSSNNDQGCIKFGESSFLNKSHNRVEKILRPEDGMVVLFPSYTWHGTIAFESDVDDFRLTAPFDIQPIAG